VNCVIDLLCARCVGELHGDILRASPRSAQPKEQEQLASSGAPVAWAVRGRLVKNSRLIFLRYQQSHR